MGYLFKNPYKIMKGETGWLNSECSLCSCRIKVGNNDFSIGGLSIDTGP